MEAFSMYNIKTQYQYRQDMRKEYDAILLDIINPIWDLVEDVLKRREADELERAAEEVPEDTGENEAGNQSREGTIEQS